MTPLGALLLKLAVADGWDVRGERDFWIGSVRLAFFFHYLAPQKPLQSPFGALALPAPSPRLDRLNVMEYEEPWWNAVWLSRCPGGGALGLSR